MFVDKFFVFLLLNAFQLKGEKAEKVYDTIFKTVKYGKTTISGIAQGFGSVAGTVAAAGIELDDYLAAVAALTTTGQPAAQAHNQLKAAIAGMTRESEDSAKVFNSLGVKSFKELIQKSGGMVNAFKAITDKVNGNDSAILGLFGSTMAYNAVLGLTTKQSQSYIDTLQSMRYGVSLIDEGYQKQYNTEHARLQRMKNLTQTIGIELGEAISPLFGKLLDLTEYGINMFGKLSPQAKSFFAISLVGFGAIASTVGVASLMGSKLLGFYGDFLSNARKLTPVLIQNSANLLKFFGLTSTAQTFTLGGLFSDIKRIDTELKYGIVSTFKTLLTKLAEQYGYIFKIAENNLVFYNVRQLTDAKAIQILYKTDFSMLSFREKTSQRYKSVEVSYFDPKKKKTLKATARNEKVEKGDTLKITARCSDKKQAIIKAKAALGNADTKIEGYFEIVGNPNLVAGGNVEIKDIGHFSGKYHITQARHVLDRLRGYKTICEVTSC